MPLSEELAAEFRRRERRLIACNALLTLMLVAMATRGPWAAGRAAGPAAGGLAGGAGGEASSSRVGRKLQQVCTCPGDLGGLAFMNLMTKIVPSATGVQFPFPVEFLQGFKVINGDGAFAGSSGVSVTGVRGLDVSIGGNKLSVKTTGIEVSSGGAGSGAAKLVMSGAGAASELSVRKLEVVEQARLGTQWAGDASGKNPVALAYGDVWVGRQTTSSPTHLTRIRPGKVVTSWPEMGEKGGEVRAETSLGLKPGDQPGTINDLSVYGSATIGLRTKARASEAGTVLRVHGDSWFGNEASGNARFFLTRIRPGKVVTSWPNQDTKSTVIPETYIGRKPADPFTVPQLFVWGSANISASTALTADKAGRVMHVNGDAWFGPWAPPNTPTYLTRVRVGRVTTSWPAAGWKPPMALATEEAYIGRKSSDPATANQVFSFGPASFANGKHKFA